MLSDLLVLLYINFISNPLLCPISYVLLQHLFLSGLHKTVSTSKIIPLPFKYFSKALFISLSSFFLSNFFPDTYFYTPILFVFMQSSNSSSVKESTNYSSLKPPLKHWPSLKVLCSLLPEENCTNKLVLRHLYCFQNVYVCKQLLILKHMHQGRDSLSWCFLSNVSRESLHNEEPDLVSP